MFFPTFIYICLFLCLYKRKVVVSRCHTVESSLHGLLMEFREDTNDSWVFDVDETQFVEKDNDTMIWDAYQTAGSTDSWVWEVDESQYGGADASNTVTSESVESFYTISEVRQVKSKKFSTTAMDYSVSFNDLKDLNLIQEYERTQKIFEQLLADVTSGMEESDLIRFVLRTEQLDKPISLPFMTVSRLTPERVFFSN